MFIQSWMWTEWIYSNTDERFKKLPVLCVEMENWPTALLIIITELEQCSWVHYLFLWYIFYDICCVKMNDLCLSLITDSMKLWIWPLNRCVHVYWAGLLQNKGRHGRIFSSYSDLWPDEILSSLLLLGHYSYTRKSLTYKVWADQAEDRGSSYFWGD